MKQHDRYALNMILFVSCFHWSGLEPSGPAVIAAVFGSILSVAWIDWRDEK